MKGYLLDTNICIFAFRGEYGISNRMRQYGEGCCYVSDLTNTEGGWMRVQPLAIAFVPKLKRITKMGQIISFGHSPHSVETVVIDNFPHNSCGLHQNIRSGIAAGRLPNYANYLRSLAEGMARKEEFAL